MKPTLSNNDMRALMATLDVGGPFSIPTRHGGARRAVGVLRRAQKALGMEPDACAGLVHAWAGTGFNAEFFLRARAASL